MRWENCDKFFAFSAKYYIISCLIFFPIIFIAAFLKFHLFAAILIILLVISLLPFIIVFFIIMTYEIIKDILDKSKPVKPKVNKKSKTNINKNDK